MTKLSIDLEGGYTFPTHISPTDLRPDIVWWDDNDKVVVMVELTIPFETSFEAAAERKESKYEELVTAARRNGFDTTLITIEVES